ncbi:hypothetical protein NPS52_02055 [Pseudomonas putida]|uniref:hypothetical protein n=1 Tax=Pseudomonas putida TaxID=303 RepID=UPI0023638D68|nr:hypothetical protein [Pseudomonas putida]MDD2149429.1 hypothetical protein [Pseudomonas putida]
MHSLLGECGQAYPALVTSVEGSILAREFAHERAAQQADVSQDWLNAADIPTTGIIESAADDIWNMKP